MSGLTTDVIPFTSAQRLVWLGQRLNPRASLYNMALSFELPDSVDERRFLDAWAALVAEEPMLRCALHDDPRAPGLVPGRASETIAVSAADAQQVESLTRDYVERSFETGENLTRSVLFNVGGHRTWLLVQHHLVTDLASFFVIQQRLAAHYDGDTDEVAPGEFASFSAREQALRESADVSAARDSAASMTQDYEPAFGFFERAVTIPDWQNTRYAQVFSRTGIGRAGEAVFGQDLRDYFEFLTALAILLVRLNARTRVHIGVPVHNRTNRKRQSTVGMLVEILPLVVDILETDTVDDVRNQVARSFMALMQAGTTGIVDEQLAGRFDVVLNYLQVPELQFSGNAVRANWVHCSAADPGHALRVHVWREADDANSRVLFDCREDTLDAPRATAMMDQFFEVMAQSVDASALRVADIRLLDMQRLARVIERASGPVTVRQFNGGLVAAIRSQMEHFPNRIALQEGDRELTYTALRKRVEARAGALLAAGAGADVPVVVWCDRSIVAVVDLLAVLFAGAAFVPVEVAMPRERVRKIFMDLTGAADKVLCLTDPSRAVDVTAFGGVLVTDSAGSCEAVDIDPEQTAYVLYTSGSTGTPKGVEISHGAIHDYIMWAQGVYDITPDDCFGLFTSLGFDLTLTSLLLPLVAGAALRIYPTTDRIADLAVVDAVNDNAITFAKITPSHLAFWSDAQIAQSQIRCWVLGGEQLTVQVAERIAKAQPSADVFNEYGPTEATVACMLHRYSEQDRSGTVVPVGLPASNHSIHVLDACGHPVADGIAGEIHIAGAGLAKAYLNRPDETAERFVFVDGIDSRLYRTGDTGRWNRRGLLEYLGRQDTQVKISGVRFELAELDNLLLQHPAVKAAASTVTVRSTFAEPEQHCTHCGLPDNYPDVTFSPEGVCSVCTRFEAVRDEVMAWFRSPGALRTLADEIVTQPGVNGHHCAVLFSGGKDSTYMVYQLVKLGLKPLALSLDNGYLSKGAHENIRKVVADLGIDHVYLQTDDMNRIFVDSLERFGNVCNGCFKTIYSLSMQYADSQGISTIFTGLSRGQLFETRIDDLFHRPEIPVARYDEMILSARKVYHRMDDVPGRCLGGDYFSDDACFERVRFVDFYRYVDVPLDEVYDFLDHSAPWARPVDTGRSTNCLINDAGIHVHRQTRGYHNYALPYAWDVRLGHKTRKQAIDELRDRLDPQRIAGILDEIGYDSAAVDSKRLISWVVAQANGALSAQLRDWLVEQLPMNLLPESIHVLDAMPLTANGKVDTVALEASLGDADGTRFEAPDGDDEILLARCWQAAFGLELKLSRFDNFFGTGGDSMAAILLVDEVQREGRSIALEDVFRYPTLETMAQHLSTAQFAADDDVEFDLGIDADILQGVVERNQPDST